MFYYDKWIVATIIITYHQYVNRRAGRPRRRLHMARGISEHDVHQAADALVVAGERPTVERIRAHLGTGSPNTVVRWLDTWWRGLGARLHEQRARLALPEAPQAVTALAGQWWALAIEHATAAAEKSLSTDHEAVRQEREALAEARGAFAEEAAALGEAAAGAAQARDVALARTAELERLVAVLQAQVSEITAQRDSAEAKAIEADVQRRQLIEQLEALRAQVAAERDTIDQHLRATEDRAHAEVDRARQEARELSQRVDSLVQDLRAAESSHRSELDVLRRQVAEARRDAASQRARSEALDGQLAQFRELLAGVETALKAKAKAGPVKSPPRRTKAPATLARKRLVKSTR